MSDLERGFRLSEITGILRRRAPIVAAAGLIGLVVGAFLFASAPSKYSATTRVLVQDVRFDDTAPPANQKVDLSTEEDLVKSDEVGDAVRKALDLPGDNRSVFQKVTVTTKEGSEVLEITFQAATANGARDGANAVAKAYLDARKADAESTQTKKLDALKPQIDEATQTLNAANEAVANTESGTPERTQAQATAAQAQQALNSLNAQRQTIAAVDTSAVGKIVRSAPTPAAALSKKALAMAVGVFGLFLLAGFGIALLIDRRDSRGGGRRKIEQLLPGVNIRMMPSASARKASPAEIDAAIDRLAVELAAGGQRGKATSVVIVGTQQEPPVALAEELASSLTFAGIPALFVLAGTSERPLPHAQIVTSFTDLITGPSVSGPASLPETAGAGSASAPLVTWLRPRGSAESSGLLRRAVVEALVTRAGREGFEAVVFVAPTPVRNAAAAALGQWATKTAVVVDHEESQAVEATVSALVEADVRITEVVWT